ncbi:hypothetical protein SEVIR_5G096501v4 [Setaria viridis]
MLYASHRVLTFSSLFLPLRNHLSASPHPPLLRPPAWGGTSTRPPEEAEAGAQAGCAPARRTLTRGKREEWWRTRPRTGRGRCRADTMATNGVAQCRGREAGARPRLPNRSTMPHEEKKEGRRPGTAAGVVRGEEQGRCHPAEVTREQMRPSEHGHRRG